MQAIFYSGRNRDVSLSIIVVLGMFLTVMLARTMDHQRQDAPVFTEDEKLYLDDKTTKRISIAFSGIAADWYWMRSLQYVGRKVLASFESVGIDRLEKLDLRLLPSLLDTATTLDPEFIEPYEYAAIVLPAVDVQEAIRITKKGIKANPSKWRLYQHLGYIYWQQRNYQAAAETYGIGASIPGAPPWMEAMKAKMAADGGSRATAREIYARLYEQSGDTSIRDMAQLRLRQLDSLDQRDTLQKLLQAYQTRTGRCVASWQELGPILRNIGIVTDPSGAPLDPTGVPYLLRRENCEVELDPKSEVSSH